MARQARKTAQQVAQKWSQNLGNATASMTNGANAVQVAPTQLAAANPQGYLNGVQQAVASGKWQRRLGNVSLQDWKTAYIQKGIPRVGTGATAAIPKVQAAFGPLLDFVYNTRDQVNQSNPRGSLAQNMARMNAFVQAMSQYNK